LPSDLEEEDEEDWSSPMFDDLYLEEDDLLEKEESTDDIADYEEVDEDLPSDVPNFSDEELDDVDFLGVDDILSDSHNINCDEFYADEENYMFIKETTTNPFLSIVMAYPLVNT
jgi:hypothetical protein